MHKMMQSKVALVVDNLINLIIRYQRIRHKILRYTASRRIIQA